MFEKIMKEVFLLSLNKRLTIFVFQKCKLYLMEYTNKGGFIQSGKKGVTGFKGV
jgi:hypothetical protein